MENEPTLLWSERFTSPELDRTIWNFDIGDGATADLIGWGNHEREYYTEGAAKTGGLHGLVITAKRETADSGLNCFYGPAEWTSAKIHTAGKLAFKYGEILITAKVPAGLGTWPALWLLGESLTTGTKWPACGEIDLLEGLGREPFSVRGTIHGQGFSGEHGLSHAVQHSELLSDSFHTYSLRWKEDEIAWAFNGVEYFKVERSNSALVGKEWPFNEPHYLILNLAMGGWLGGDIDSDLSEARLMISSIEYRTYDGTGKLISY